ncbi:Dual 3',5'-cyclic-AMP and -GMP phosphodiesterase 11 [Gryllus bimaculatus]|nr:Dual 3',5'-cyclic-AMP and -GMP phosphodiesterase 11 [Gryllus bimaculatus]
MQLVWPTVNAARAGRGGAGRAGGSRGSAAGRTDSVNAPPPAHTPARPLAHPSVRSHNQTPTYPPPRCPPVRPCVHLPARPTRRPDLPSAYPPTRGGGGGGGGSPRSWRFKKASDKEKAAAPPAGAAGLVNPAARPNAPQRDALILRRGLTDKFYHQQGALKVLLVFAKDDATVAALRGAAGQLGYECSLARNSASCVDAFQSRCHDLVIVDNRDPKTLDGEAIGKALRAVKSSQFSVFVALVKRSETEKQDCSILPYINAGYDRWVVEVTSAAPFVSELLQMDTSEVQPRKQLWAYHSFLLMAERSRELCIITDYSHHIVYANRAVERAVGSSAKELYGRCVYDLVHVDSRERLLNAAVKGREWEGVATVAPRRNSETMMLQCRVMPNGAVGRAPANLVFMLEPPPKRGSEAGMSGRGSVPSVRRGSADMRSVCSDGLRRQSVTKLNTLSIEAPITKVVTLISQAQEQSSPEVSLMLDKCARTDCGLTTLSPPISYRRFFSVVAPTTRRSSNDSAVGRGVHAPRGSRSAPNASTQLSVLLESSLLWEFDIFKLEELSGQRPLLHLGMNLMEHFEVPQTLNVDMNTVHNWLSIIEMNYRATNTYHNSSHAADVMQSSAAFLERERLQRILDPLDNACCLIAAAVHDVDHPGRSSAFLCNSDHELAILYNDICVLESHHAALAFRLTVSDERVNIFKGLERDVYKMVRLSIIDMVLATEMTKHFEHLAKFVNVFSKPVREDDESSHLGADTEGAVMTQENIALAKRMLIKCADVSNPARPLRQCVEWALRIAEEYFQQTDEEKSKQLPVVMPMFDRASCSIPKSQIGFMDFIINDMFEAWEEVVSKGECREIATDDPQDDARDDAKDSDQDDLKDGMMNGAKDGAKSSLKDRRDSSKSSGKNDVKLDIGQSSKQGEKLDRADKRNSVKEEEKPNLESTDRQSGKSPVKYDFKPDLTRGKSNSEHDGQQAGLVSRKPVERVVGKLDIKLPTKRSSKQEARVETKHSCKRCVKYSAEDIPERPICKLQCNDCNQHTISVYNLKYKTTRDRQVNDIRIPKSIKIEKSNKDKPDKH